MNLDDSPTRKIASHDAETSLGLQPVDLKFQIFIGSVAAVALQPELGKQQHPDKAGQLVIFSAYDINHRNLINTSLFDPKTFGFGRIEADGLTVTRLLVCNPPTHSGELPNIRQGYGELRPLNISSRNDSVYLVDLAKIEILVEALKVANKLTNGQVLAALDAHPDNMLPDQLLALKNRLR